MCGFLLELKDLTQLAHPVYNGASELRVLTLGVENTLSGDRPLLHVLQ